MSVGFKTIFPKIGNSAFTVKNTTAKTIKVFGQGIGAGQSYNLIDIPYVSEADIKHSLLKGELQKKISQREIIIQKSNLNLAQYDSEFTEFLRSAGATVGTEDFSVGISNITSLSALDDSFLSHGSVISVATVLNNFILDKTSDLVVDNIVVVPTRSGTGRWLRQIQSSERWLNQNTWYVNADTGNDENDGNTSSTSLKTLTEFTRRTNNGKCNISMVINLETDINEGEITFNSTYNQRVTIVGTTTVVGTGTFTNAVSYNGTVSPGIDGYIVDDSIPISWTSSNYVEKFIEISSGANSGSGGWIIKDLGLKSARFSPFLNPNTSAVINPSVGESYRILNVTRIFGNVALNITGPGDILFMYVKFDAADPDFHSSLLMQFGSGLVVFCSLTGPTVRIDHGISFFQMYGSMISTTTGTFQIWGGPVDLSGCAIMSTLRTANPSANINIFEDTVIQEGTLEARDGGLIVIAEGVFLAGFDGVGNLPMIVLGPNSYMHLRGKVWGLDWGTAGSRGLWVAASATVVYTAGDDFIEHADIQGTTTEIDYGGLTTTFTAVGMTGVINSTNHAKIVPGSFTP